MKCMIGAFVLFAALAITLSVPEHASAQDAATVVYPDQNVTGAALSARRPGLRVSAGIGTVVERHQQIFYNHDGASPQPREELDLRTDLLVAVLQQLFDTLQTLFSPAGLLGALGGTTTTTTGT